MAVKNEFVMKLYRMLGPGESNSRDIIAWGAGGDSFVIKDIYKLSATILPKYFKHSNFSSFVRQLNKYGFHKIKLVMDDDKIDSWVFSHLQFFDGNQSEAHKIKRNDSGRTHSTSRKESRAVSAKPYQKVELDRLRKEISELKERLVTQEEKYMSLVLEVPDLMISGESSTQSKAYSSQEHLDYPFAENLKAILDDSLQSPTSICPISLDSYSSILNPSPFVSFPLQPQHSVRLSENCINEAEKEILGYILDPQTCDPSDAESINMESDIDGELVQPSITALVTLSSLQAVTPSAAEPKDKWAIIPRVLLVDDDDVCRRLGSKFLTLCGCVPEAVADGLNAIDKMNTTKYDLVLMDIIMPGLDGVAATTLIRSQDTVTPIISMTSNFNPSAIMAYHLSGMNDILSKPFNKTALKNVLEKHLIHLQNDSDPPIEFITYIDNEVTTDSQHQNNDLLVSTPTLTECETLV